MNRAIITITEEGLISIPRDVQMSILEIAHLFELSYTRIKRMIRSIEKQGVVNQIDSKSYTFENNKIVCDYYGLEMIVAVAFQVQSLKAKFVREWVVRQMKEVSNTQSILVSINHVNAVWN